MVAVENLYLEWLDVKIMFLHDHLDKEIYMKHSIGVIKEGKEDMVCRLKKSLYGWKHAPKQCYLKFDEFVQCNSYTRCKRGSLLLP